ncbi:hypothetical protein SG34_000180 [Thalassomonas viridans]|uniref:Uncharacterized protein n=1 Tax=Thalassomonas viridans TaxID=137584 RepID=A0AAE9Z3I5_9GAMM|nr:hypothetical protein [Thalassomonas viridans]WDE05405.1 hypothetical protein SG34_000180 [Thalassomonas viridans]
MKMRILLLCLCCITSQVFAATLVQIGGPRYTLTTVTPDDFYAVAGGYQADITIEGEYGQELQIDIAMRISGHADQNQPSPSPLLYFYDAELTAICSNTAIGQDSSYAYRMETQGELQALINRRMSFNQRCTNLTLTVNSTMLNPDIEIKLAMMEVF